MTPQNKELAILLGEALTVVLVRYVLSSRNGQDDSEVVARRQRHIWIHAIAAEATRFVVDQIILQRRRAAAAIERASIAATLPAVETAASPRLPRQPRQSSAPLEA